MISPKFVERQKNKLIEERSHLLNKIKKLKKFPNYGDNEDDNARELADFESNLSLEEQLTFLVKKIDKALLAIEKNGYGRCSKCQGAVEEGRLEIMPYAELCVSCKQKENQ